MELSQLHVETLRAVCGSLRPHKLAWDSASGMLVGSAPVTPELHASLDLLISAGVLDDHVEIDQQPVAWTAMTASSSRVIAIELPVTEWASGEYVVYRNLATLIGRGLFLTQPPAHCYLIDEDVLLPEEDGNTRVANYQRAVALAGILAQNADHIDRSDGRSRLVFLHKVSLVVPVDFTAEDLAVPIAGLDDLRALLTSDEHREQKRSILKATLHDLLSGEPEGERFRALLLRLGDLDRQFRERYQLFVAEFDFEEVREELEEKRRDYLARLNGAFHEMGAKLFSVPLAFYLALAKLEPLPPTGSPFEVLVQSSIVALAVILVCVYVWMLLSSHRQTVDATRDEYLNLLERWRLAPKSPEKSPEYKKQVERTLSALEQRHRQVLRYFLVTRWTLILTLAFTVGLYLMRLLRAEATVWGWLQALKGLIPF